MASSVYWPDWGALAVAVVALVQPWGMALWKRYFRKGRLEAFESGNLEVGFGNYGPSLAVLGTLRAVHQDMFVKSMRVEVVRKRDGAKLYLNWRAFRPNAIAIDAGTPQAAEVASGFLVAPTAPEKFNIFFASEQFTADHKAQANRVIDAWNRFVSEQVAKLDPKLENQIATVLQNPTLTRSLYDEFSKSSEVVALYADLNHTLYWHPSEYEAALVAELVDSEVVLSNWTFTLTEEDSKQLRLNVLSTLETLCGIQTRFFFAYPEYRKAPAQLPAQAKG